MSRILEMMAMLGVVTAVWLLSCPVVSATNSHLINNQALMSAAAAGNADKVSDCYNKARM